MICYASAMATDGTAPSDGLASVSLAADLSFLMARANALSLAAGNAALRPFGLSVRSFSVLALTVDDHRPTQRDLAAFLRLDPSQVVALVDGLQQRGIVERRPDPNDRRANVLVATDEGREVYSSAVIAARAAERELHSALDPAEREQLAALLRRVAFVD